MKDLSLAIKINELEEIEEKFIIKRWQSPSIIEALSLPTAARWVIFCTAVFFKYRAVNKRIQLYDAQIKTVDGIKIGNMLQITFLLFSEIIQIVIGALIYKYSNGRR